MVSGAFSPCCVLFTAGLRRSGVVRTLRVGWRNLPIGAELMRIGDFKKQCILGGNVVREGGVFCAGVVACGRGGCGSRLGYINIRIC